MARMRRRPGKHAMKINERSSSYSITAQPTAISSTAPPEVERVDAQANIHASRDRHGDHHFTRERRRQALIVSTRHSTWTAR